MDDLDIARQIDKLTTEEHRLEQSHVGEGLSKEEAARLRAVEIELDQCWDLLRQRRARRESGGNPDDATVRPAQVVEDYEQ
jgi:hypothetical protein